MGLPLVPQPPKTLKSWEGNKQYGFRLNVFSVSCVLFVSLGKLVGETEEDAEDRIQCIQIIGCRDPSAFQSFQCYTSPDVT